MTALFPAALVTVRGLDGSTKTGRLALFDPHRPDLTLELASANGEASARMAIAAERIAYVGAHRAPKRRAAPSGDLVKVHVARGEAIVVRMVREGEGGAIGFYGAPDDPASPYEEIFFYAHGVNAKENCEPIGAMLVRTGSIAPADLERAVSAQQAGRAAPIGQILVEQKRLSEDAVEQAAALQSRRKLRIGEVLVEAGLATVADIEHALKEQRKRRGKRLGEVLVELCLVDELDLALTLAKKFHLPFVDLDQVSVDPRAAAEIGDEVIVKFGVLPIASEARVLTVAMSDPLAVDAVDALRFASKKRIHEVVATPTQLRRHIAKHLARAESTRLDGEMELILEELSVDEPQPPSQRASQATVDEADSGVIKVVNQIILDAYRRGASDIHVEPNGRERSTTVRFRVDGECVSYRELPPNYRSAIVARLKIMAKLDISERRKPQDGKIRFMLRERAIELRVATLPTVDDNEDVVLRILAASKPLPLDELRLSARNLQQLRRLIARPYGLVLCVGPTGSGKTTTLHSILGAINTVDMKIWTAEDPVEITQAGLRQVQVQPKIGFTFAAAMRAFLRADPDVIMVGEMRDAETASTAVEASLTGHLVFSTLHTNSAPETVTRLVDIGVDPFGFADALLGVVAQRLARALCRSCREPYAASDAERAKVAGAGIALDGALTLHRGRGCEACGGSGYKGRIGLHELLVVDEEIQRLIQRKQPVGDLRRAAMSAGMTTLLQDGIAKAIGGLTDLTQVFAVCSQ